jgi:hypothetical protein
MSSFDHPEMPRWAHAGCLIYALAGSLFCLGNFFVWWMGPCPAFSSNTNCSWSQARELWYFPISQLTFVTVGILMLRLFRKIAAGRD